MNQKERAARIRRSWEEGLCPQCSAAIPGGKGVGTGKRSDGTFCSLDCIARFHGPMFIERHIERIKKIRQAEQN